MKYLRILWTNLLRRKLRSLFTILSVFIAFVLFGLLAAIGNAFGGGVELADQDRLISLHRVSITQFLPLAHADEIRAVDGVEALSHSTWFGGVYQEPGNFFPQFAVPAEQHLDLHDELVLPDEQRRAWLADPAGAVAGASLARRFGWQVGDRIPLRATIWTRLDGAEHWELNLRGIYRGREAGVDTGMLLFHYDHLDQSRAYGHGLVSFFEIGIDDPARAGAVAAEIDGLFANSPFQTKTTTAAAFATGFANQVGNVGALTASVLAAVFFTMLVVSGTTMMQALRERRGEVAVLKSLGFDNQRVAGLMIGEALLLVGLGGVLGLVVSWLVVSAGDPTGGALPGYSLGSNDLALGLLLVVVAGLAVGLLPAAEAVRLQPARALRRV